MFWSVSTRLQALALRLVEAIHAINSLDHLVAGAFQGKRHHLPDGGRVINGEYGLGHRSFLGFCD
jgi:hypothetical protein